MGVVRYEKGAWDRSVRWGDGGVGLVRLNEMEYGEMGVLDVGCNGLVRLIRSCCVPNKSSTIEAATWETSAAGDKKPVRLNQTSRKSCTVCMPPSSHTGILPPWRPLRQKGYSILIHLPSPTFHQPSRTIKCNSKQASATCTPASLSSYVEHCTLTAQRISSAL
jgi:hypothetical protein